MPDDAWITQATAQEASGQIPEPIPDADVVEETLQAHDGQRGEGDTGATGAEQEAGCVAGDGALGRVTSLNAVILAKQRSKRERGQRSERPVVENVLNSDRQRLLSEAGYGVPLLSKTIKRLDSLIDDNDPDVALSAAKVITSMLPKDTTNKPVQSSKPTVVKLVLPHWMRPDRNAGIAATSPRGERAIPGEVASQGEDPSRDDGGGGG